MDFNRRYIEVDDELVSIITDIEGESVLKYKGDEDINADEKIETGLASIVFIDCNMVYPLRRLIIPEKVNKHNPLHVVSANRIQVKE